jgi:hypothetical protein
MPGAMAIKDDNGLQYRDGVDKNQGQPPQPQEELRSIRMSGAFCVSPGGAFKEDSA